MQTSNLGLNSKCAWGCITCQVCVCVYVVCSCVCVRVKGCVVYGLHMHALTRIHICVYICIHRTIVLGNTAEDSVQRYFPSTCCSVCCSVFQCVWRSRVYVLMKRDYQRDQYMKQPSKWNVHMKRCLSMKKDLHMKQDLYIISSGYIWSQGAGGRQLPRNASITSTRQVHSCCETAISITRTHDHFDLTHSIYYSGGK